MSASLKITVDAVNRNMLCPECRQMVSVPKRINRSVEASKVAIRVEMAKHLSERHPNSRYLRNEFSALAPQKAPQPQPDSAVRETVLALLDERPVQSPVTADDFRAMVRAEVAKMSHDRTFTVVHADSKVPVTIKRCHSMLREVLRTVNAGFKNLLLVGPAGTGKTTLAMQAGESLKRPFGILSFTSGITEGMIIGRLSSTGKYLPSQMAEMFEKPGVFLLDEMDRADANVILILNAALEQGLLALPDGRILKRHENFVIIAGANTWGTGADWQYVGANQLDASTLSRFAGAILEIGYDEALERSLVSEEWYVAFVAVRVSCMKNIVRRVMGTREMLAGYKLLKGGFTAAETWDRLTAGWSNDERRKGGIPNVA